MIKHNVCIRTLALLILLNLFDVSNCAATDIVLDAKAQSTHRLDTLNLLSYTFLLILTVLTIWLFKHRRVSFLHETGLAVIYGLIVGAIIRYAGSTGEVLHMSVVSNDQNYNSSLPPDALSLNFPVKSSSLPKNKTYEYTFRGEIQLRDNEIDLKATFDPEIFFNIILP
ncbi:Na/H antiporter, partial [Oryctes borbonicus]